MRQRRCCFRHRHQARVGGGGLAISVGRVAGCGSLLFGGGLTLNVAALTSPIRLGGLIALPSRERSSSSPWYASVERSSAMIPAEAGRIGGPADPGRAAGFSEGSGSFGLMSVGDRHRASRLEAIS